MNNRNRGAALHGMSEEELLAQQFSAIDENGDGRVDRDEMDRYLAQQGLDEEHRYQIVDELFEKCDKDGNQRIELAEFSGLYVSTKNQLVEREAEIKQNIVVNNQKLKQARQELEKAKKVHGNFI